MEQHLDNPPTRRQAKTSSLLNTLHPNLDPKPMYNMVV